MRAKPLFLYLGSTTGKRPVRKHLPAASAGDVFGHAFAFPPPLFPVLGVCENSTRAYRPVACTLGRWKSIEKIHINHVVVFNDIFTTALFPRVGVNKSLPTLFRFGRSRGHCVGECPTPGNSGNQVGNSKRYKLSTNTQ